MSAPDDMPPDPTDADPSVDLGSSIGRAIASYRAELAALGVGVDALDQMTADFARGLLTNMHLGRVEEIARLAASSQMSPLVSQALQLMLGNVAKPGGGS